MARKSKNSAKGQSEKEFAVIGLGRFGASLARRLETMGHTVLGVDSDLALVQAISDDITSAVAIDVTNEDALAEVDIASFETAIVALDDDFEASALVVAYLKGLGIARVICRGRNGTAQRYPAAHRRRPGDRVAARWAWQVPRPFFRYWGARWLSCWRSRGLAH